MFDLSRKKSGFTLVELLVVIAIIAILAAVVMPKLLGYTDKAREARAMADIGAMKTVVEVYAADEGHGKYPANDAILSVLDERGIGDGANMPEDPWGNEYVYQSADDGTYVIASPGTNGKFKEGETEETDDIFTTESKQPQKGDSGIVEPAPGV